MVKKIQKYHKESESPFYKLRTKARLAKILFIGKSKLKSLCGPQKKYHSFTKTKKDGGKRLIDAPQDDLKAAQSRIAQLLQRITPPDFLFAPVAGRSYVDNAAVHIGARSGRLLDIKDFFPSCTANKVIWFFRTRMGCSDDIAVMLKEIVTLNSSLPQGSPCSPILAYLCYVDMWREVEILVSNSQCRLSVYADDITISGQIIPEKMIWRIKETLYRHGHRYHLEKERSHVNRPSKVTGVILTRNGLKLPNCQHQKIFQIKKQIRATRSLKEQSRLEMQLRGRIAQKNQVIEAS